MNKVLIIEDELAIADLIAIHLKDLNKEVSFATDGNMGLKLAKSESYDLIILDLMLPELNGIEVCKELRKSNINTPVLMLTAKSEEFDKVLGLEIGADDYMTKPFSVREFTARAKALMRRSTSYASTEQIQDLVEVGELIIDQEKRRVSKGADKLDLTAKEFDLLFLLASNPGKSYTRGKLLELVWGYNFSGYEHTVNSHINRLRSKIETSQETPLYIKTVWGVGYAFNDDL
ncbi:MAG: two-component system alkaline phosphatase synthesis response regulator PhoP [Saprospiraceae bacterium]|jgi:two-component system alkaline phosphatase synthesis response regulator PhoP